jgi:tryptophanyl-tRNA synthetase
MTSTGGHVQRVFSGVQPTGNLHLGNYLGAVKRFVEMQGRGIETLYCVVDLHAITVPQEPAELKRAIRELTAAFLACGLDPSRSVIFNQSQVAAHAELAWLFNCVARIGWLNRMTQFKEKAGKDREGASVGLFAYPVLMAADILVYKATHVPVGEDQKQHLELARDIAAKFNLDFAAPDYFPQPEPMIEGEATRVMSLRDGTKKMSKSDPSDLSRINLTDDADAIAMKIRKAQTDPEPLPETVEGLEGRPGAANLVAICAALSDRSRADVLAEWGGKPFSAFKPALAEIAVEKVGPIAGRMRELLADPGHIDRVLGDGAERAAAIAEPVVRGAYALAGLLRSRP